MAYKKDRSAAQQVRHGGHPGQRLRHVALRDTAGTPGQPLGGLVRHGNTGWIVLVALLFRGRAV